MKKEKQKQIPIKNYIIVIVMFIVTVLLVFGIRSWYRSYVNYKYTIPVIRGKIQEIKLKELEDYISENDNYYIYIGESNNKFCRKIEKELPEVLERRNIETETIYLNMDGSSEKELKELLNKSYKEEINIKYPIFIIIKDKKVLSFTKNNNIDISDIEKILDEYEIGK